MSDLFELIGERTPCRQLTLFAGAWYTYGYLPGTDLKASLAVGTAGRTDWTYEPNRDLLTQVKNTAFGSVVSQYDYVNDALGRRTEIARSGARMTETRSDTYSYNARSELTNAVKNATLNEYAYQYDDIGNRLASLDLGTNRTYVANLLNQYISISNSALSATPREIFTPVFDLDGNQTLVRTTTGDWSVTYNGENRPVSWSCGATNITMQFDRMGRRVEYLETESIEESVVSDGITNIVVTVTTNAHHRFVYDGYLCIQRLNALSNNAVDLAFGWDPIEPVATRPLWMQRPAGSYNFFYFHDGNKNVSDLVSYQSARGVPAHYEYAPFGAVTAATTNTVFTAFNVAETNPYRFSSEYADDALGLVYYNYRHYEPVMGRWLMRDPVDHAGGMNLYLALDNHLVFDSDRLGLMECVLKSMTIDPSGKGWELDGYGFNTQDAMHGMVVVKEIVATWRLYADVECCCWAWYWNWGRTGRKRRVRISKSVKFKEKTRYPYVGYTLAGYTTVPSPVTIYQVLGEIAAQAISSGMSNLAIIFASQDARELAELILNTKPSTTDIGYWPGNKCLK